MKSWTVTIPIAGHVVVSVEAETEEEAIDKAWEEASGEEPEFELLESFNSGNCCNCPSPWEVQAEEEDSDED